MVFSSVLFIFLFLPLTLITYFAVPKGFRNALLLVFSLVFYAWGETFLVILLLASLLINYSLSLVIDRCSSERGPTLRAKLFLTAAVICNLIPLIYYKYSNFAVQEFSSIFGTDYAFIQNWKNIALPFGISFYTFQAMSYVVDVYRRDTPAAPSFTNFACYVTCFPQLVAGPIVRYKDISKQLIERSVSVEKFSAGTRRFIIGLAKKVLIANTVAVTADYCFGLPVDQLDLAHAWLGAICYSLQIYYDFSGYSDMAIGMGLMLGFRFPENFNYPYVAKSIQDFWRRWHMSLSTWFRDYLYIPLGGSRGSRWRTYLNLWIVFLLCGLWHGASWNFVLWGAFHGLFLVLERSKIRLIFEGFPKVFNHLYVFVVVIVGWVLFRSETLSHTQYYLASMFGLGAEHSGFASFQMLNLGNDVLLAILLGTLFSAPLIVMADRVPSKAKHLLMPVAYLGIFYCCLTFLANNTYNPFLYFRF